MKNDSIIDMLSKPILILLIVTIALIVFANVIG